MSRFSWKFDDRPHHHHHHHHHPIMQIVSPFQCIVIIVQQRERTQMPIRDIGKYLLAYQY